MIIDVVLPTFNRAHFLKRSVESILNQTYQKLNLIIIDDGSTDQTFDVLMPYLKNDERVTYHKTQNWGVSAARNKGVSLAQNQWIAFCDSDDEWLPHKLETQVHSLKLNPDLSFCHSNEIWMNLNIKINQSQKFNKNPQKCQKTLFKNSLQHCLISPSTVMIKKDLFFHHHGFDENLLICEDYDLWNIILATAPIGFIEDELIIKHGGHLDQLSKQSPSLDFYRVKSLVKLYLNPKLPEFHKSLVLDTLKIKSDRLLSTLKKHQRLEDYQLIKDLLVGILF